MGDLKNTSLNFSDAHCHFAEGDSPVLESGISKVCLSACFEKDWRCLSRFGVDSGKILKSYGLHPASKAGNSEVERLKNFLPKADAVGEIGFDSRSFSEFGKSSQRNLFSLQVELASEFELPIIVHCVGAWGELIEALSENFFGKKGFLIHGAACSADIAARLRKLGGYFSFGERNLRFPKAANCLREAGEDRFLLESDSDSLVGAGARLDRAAKMSAEILGLGVDRVAELSRLNFDRFYHGE